MSGRASRTTNDRSTNDRSTNGPADPVAVETTGDGRIEPVDTLGSGIGGGGDAGDPPKRGEKLADYYRLTRDALATIVPDDEAVRAAFVDPGGTTLERDGRQQHLADTVGFLVTDRRLVFVRPTVGDRLQKSIPYGDVAALRVDGPSGTVLTCTTTDGERWGFELPADEPAVVDAVRRHLEWIGEVRPRILRFREDLHTATDRIENDAQLGDWGAAKDRYDRFRDRLDTLTCAVQLTEPVADHVLAPELATMERDLERARLRLVVERAGAALDRVDSLVADEDYEEAASLVATARTFHSQASLHADALLRGDEFRFGTQRELGEALDRLGWRVETLAAEPLRAATEARIRAQQVSSPKEARVHCEAALRRYRKLAPLAGEDGPLAGSESAIARAATRAAKRLAELHWTLGRQRWIAAAKEDLMGSDTDANGDYSAAAEHLSVTRTLSDAYAPVESPDLEPAPDRLRSVVDSLAAKTAAPTNADVRDAIDAHLDPWSGETASAVDAVEPEGVSRSESGT